MSRRQILHWGLLAAAVALSCPCGFFGLWFAAEFGSEAGSPSMAGEWRDRLNQYSDPDAAQAADRAIIVQRFGSGEWLFGLAQDSHGIWRRGGGTVVVRDSSGRTRAFFGHVCGGGQLGIGPEPHLPDLVTFYLRLQAEGFVEHILPAHNDAVK